VNLATKLKKNKIRNLNVVRTSSLWAGFPTKVSISKRAQLDHTYLKKKIIFGGLLCVNCHFACQLNGARTSRFGLRRTYFL
jgi:hypothetical protein